VAALLIIEARVAEARVAEAKVAAIAEKRRPGDAGRRNGSRPAAAAGDRPTPTSPARGLVAKKLPFS
jgi:hypothetical protein